MDMRDYQGSIDRWMQQTFGSAIAVDKKERNDRFMEEALELVQACGMPKRDIQMLIEYVYNRPEGAKHQEVGGVIVALNALASANDLDVNQCAVLEQERVFVKIEQIRQKQLNKPRNSPLPQGY